MSAVVRIPVTIANGQTESSAANLGELAVVGIEMPTAFTGAAITFKVASSESGPFQILTKIDGTNYNVVVAAGKNVSIPPSDLAGWRHLKVVSGSAEGAARTIYLLVRTV